MQTQSNERALDLKPGARGRKDENKQEATIKLEAMSVKVDTLVGLYKHQQAVALDFSDAVKAVAEESGLNAKTVRTFIVAKSGEKFEQRKRDVQQLALVFDEVGG